MKETDIRHTLLDALNKYGHAEAIENGAGVGMPDVNFAYQGQDYWLECKYRALYPVRDSTPVFANALKASQRIWFRKRLKTGARNAHFYLRAEDEFFVIPGNAWDSIEEMSRGDLQHNCLWKGALRHCDWELLIEALQIYFAQ